MMKRLIMLAALLAAPVAGQTPAGLRVDRVVLLMRHGVRPPTKAPPMPPGTASDASPDWPVPPGYLTPHGDVAVRLIARWDAAEWRRIGLLPRQGCARVRVVADSDQRTIATGRAWAEALMPGCTVAAEHKPQDVADPLFSPIDERAVAFDPAAARAAVLDAAGPAGIAREEARLRPLLDRLDAILCATPAPDCGVARTPTGLSPPDVPGRPKLTGALDRASTAAQILLLQYTEGKPAGDVGWGRATPADVAALAEFHAAEFRLLARPRYVAKANLALLVPLMLDALLAPDGAAVTMIAGHDTNVASLGGLLDIHWLVPGLARDDPAPGGAVVLERLRDRRGAMFFRAVYRSQTVAQIRALTPLGGVTSPYAAVLPIAGCRARGVSGLCDAAGLRAALTR